MNKSRTKRISVALACVFCLGGALSVAACDGGGKYTVTFDTCGGSTVASVKLNEGAGVSRPSAVPTKEFFTFDNWYADEACTVPFEFGSAMPAGDITVYAGWNALTAVKITFDANGGAFEDGDTSVASVGVVGEAFSVLSQSPVNIGYAFGGWYKDKECTDPIDFSFYPSENVTLYASWEHDGAYAYIDYYGNGRHIATVPIKKGETASAPEFFGADIIATPWYTDKGMSNAHTFGAVNSDISLYCSYYTDGLIMENGVVTGYNGTSLDVYVPDKYDGKAITEIGEYAFYTVSDVKITSVELPQTVTKISHGAFYDCTYLSYAGLTSAVTEIAEYAFYRNLRLRDVGDISSVKAIKPYTFANCEGLREIVLSDELESVGEHAFINCSSLKEIVVPAGVEEIPANAFGGCSSLEKITLEASLLKSIDVSAFHDCTSLKAVIIESLNVPDLGTTVSPFAGTEATVYVPSKEIMDQYKIRYGYLDNDTFGDRLAVING